MLDIAKVKSQNKCVTPMAHHSLKLVRVYWHRGMPLPPSSKCDLEVHNCCANHFLSLIESLVIWLHPMVLVHPDSSLISWIIGLNLRATFHA